MKRTLVLFDIDGTLLASGGAGRRAVLGALAPWLGDAPATHGVRFDGKTDPQIIRELFQAAGHVEPPSPSLIADLSERYLAALERELAGEGPRPTVLPGVPALLDALEAEPTVVLGLLTGNIRRGAALKLASAGVDVGRFAVGAYGCDSAHRPDLPAIAAERAVPHFGEAPRGEAVVIIGDTPADVACGAGIGARALAVATGAYSVEELAACGPHATFPDLQDTPAVLRAIVAWAA